MFDSRPQSYSIQRIPRPSPLNARTLAGLLLVAAVVWALAVGGVWRQDLINPGGWSLLWRFVVAFGQPDLSRDLLSLALHSAMITLAYAVCGTTLSLVIGMLGGVLSSEVWWQTVLPLSGRRRYSLALPWLLARTVLAIPRAIHEVIWGLFFINIMGLDPLAAILAIAIPFGAITAKVFAEILDETPLAPLHALRHSGVSPLKALLYSLLPQATPDLLSYTFYRLECAIRSAAVLGLIGAGGLGYQILLSLQSLRYEQMWTFLFALILLSGLTDVWSGFVRRRLLGISYTKLNVCAPARPATPIYRRDSWTRLALFLAALTVPLSFWYVGADWGKLLEPRTGRLLAGVFHDAFPPRLEPALLVELMQLSAQTLSMSILAMVFAGVGGLLLSFPAARHLFDPPRLQDGGDGSLAAIGRSLQFVLARGLLLILRAIAEPIWAFIVLLVFFPGILPGAIGLGLYNLGIVGRLMAEVTENLDQRPLQALKAQGVPHLALIAYGVLPLALPRHVAYLLYRWEVCIRATVVVGLVGAGGLGRLLTEQLARFDYRGVITTLIVFGCLTLLVDGISTVTRRALR